MLTEKKNDGKNLVLLLSPSLSFLPLLLVCVATMFPVDRVFYGSRRCYNDEVLWRLCGRLNHYQPRSATLSSCCLLFTAKKCFMTHGAIVTQTIIANDIRVALYFYTRSGGERGEGRVEERERGTERSRRSHRVRSEQLKESRDDGMRSEAGVMIREQN